MGKRELARGDVPQGQIPMYIRTHATPNEMHPPDGLPDQHVPRVGLNAPDVFQFYLQLLSTNHWRRSSEDR